MTARYNIAHRGARSLAPENTMNAFLKAWQLGAHGVETDVSVTADGQLVLFHDIILLRTTDVARRFPERVNQPLHAFTLEEVRTLDAGSWFVDRDPFAALAGGMVTAEEAHAMRGAAVPLLSELLHFVREKSWFALIEIKPLHCAMSRFPVAEEVLHCLEEVGLNPSQFAVSSFQHAYLRRVRELRPEVELNALIGEDISRPHDWGVFEFPVYNANIDLIDSLQIEEARRRGCRVNLYTVNRQAEMRHYLAHGVDKIITDYPQLLLDK